MNENLLDLCRLCLRTSEFKYSLFAGSISDKIESLTSIKILKDDRLPKTACGSCIANVFKSYRFQQRIIKSEKTLRNRLSHNELQIIEDAKQTPDLFEILHVESPSHNDAIKLLEPKVEDTDELENTCNYVECVCKTELTDISTEHCNSTQNTSDHSHILDGLLENTSSTENSNDFNVISSSTVEHIDVHHFEDTLPKLNKNNIFSNKKENDVLSKKIKVEVRNVENVITHNMLTDSIVKDSYNKKLQPCKQNLERSDHNISLALCTTDSLLEEIQSKLRNRYTAYSQKRQVPDNPKLLECVDCDIKFETKRMLQQHMTKHKIDKCPFCSITMRSDNLKKHIQIHTDSPEICEICGKMAKNKESLRGHVNYQHKSTRKFKCEYCCKEFKSSHHHKTHVKTIHLGIKNHQCHICGKKFFGNHDLNRHINMTHKGARPYICQYCKKGFSSPYARKTHIRLHTLETPYRCEICAAGFRQKVSLVTHMKSKHSI